ncbi:MAG: 2,3-diphosphoglycerate-dependent phosphoglycerate mutase [Bacteriovoracaceae bacterium]
MKTYEIVVVRHGQSVWNKENRFTGWVNVNLSEQGLSEAKAAGELLKKNNISFTKMHTSYLNRAIKTGWTILEELGLMSIPVQKSWELNERHYGGLQGKNKKETAEIHGDDQVKIWRRSFDTPPPELTEEQDLSPAFLYEKLETIPKSESLKDTCQRVIPFWNDVIAKDVLAGEKILIAAHGNSIRGLLKHLKNISDEEIVKLEIPTGKPIVVKLDENLKAVEDFFLS